MNENENKYLSLKTAAGLYGYTRDHLGLMIRQGKLKGIKLGSYYVTTNEWLTDYLKKYADPGHPAIASKFSNKFLTQTFASRSLAETSLARRSLGVAGAKEGGGAQPSLKLRPASKETKSKTPQVSVSNKFGDDFFSEIQKELLSSLQELSAARRETGALPASPARRYAISGNPYIILPIRKMEESERESILRKIYNRNGSENKQETV